MSTLSQVRSRIADSLNRTDLSTQIDLAINRAIKYFGQYRFYFNEARTTFSTVANQKSYGTADSVPSYLQEIDQLKITVNSSTYPLKEITYQEIEAIDVSAYAGQPTHYAFYQEKIWLYPIPSAVYTVTISYQKGYADLSLDADTNDFTEEAEDLIESNARWWINDQILYEYDRAAKAKEAESIALNSLISRTEKLAGNNVLINPTRF